MDFPTFVRGSDRPSAVKDHNRMETPKGVWHAVAVMAFLLAALSLFRHWHYLSQAFDLGFYVQDVWAISQGTWRNTVGGFHVFADHFSPVLILMAPAAFLSTAEFMLLVQAAAVATGIFPAYKIGHRYGGPRLGRLAAVWYGLSAAIWHAVAYDFHPVTLGIPLLLCLIYEADTGRNRLLQVGLALGLAMLREDLAVLGGLVLVQAAFLRGHRRDALLGLAPALVGVGYITWVTLASNEMGGYHLWTRFPGPGSSSTIDSLVGAVGNLGRVDTLVSFSAVLLPVLAIPALMGWRRSWPGLAMMLVNGFASYEQQASLYYQYFGPVVPFILWGSVASWIRFRQGAMANMANVATVMIFVLLGPVAYVGFGLPDRFATTIALSADRGSISDVIDGIPGDAVVSATEMVLPHLAARAEVYPFPGPMVCAESLIFHVDETSFPRFVAIEWQDAVPGVDWRTMLAVWGYAEVASNAEVAVWTLVGDPPGSIACPSIDEVRRNLTAKPSLRDQI